MKLRNLLPLVVATAIISFSSCKKTDSSSDEIETTFELSGDQAIADNLTQDANDILNEAAKDRGVYGSVVNAPATTDVIFGCANVTATPLIGFPKTLVVDFGTGCTGPYGITRSGKITIVLTDTLRKSGSIATMTFDNYYVSGFKKEGTITWTNTSTATVRSWERKVENGKITAPSGNYWTHSGIQQIVQSAGGSTPLDFTDDVYLITGNHTTTNSAGRTRTGTILTALEKKASCGNIDMGTVQIQGPNHVAIINYGNGNCDNLATISIDGRPERTFILR